jgi:pyruvate formate lyase activating enzyme
MKDTPSPLASARASLKGLEPFSLCDWPGRPSAVLFCGGCDLRCPHCHNAGIAWEPDSAPSLDWPVVEDFLARRAPWLDGLVVSGGEPTLVAGLPELLADLSRFGLPIKLDSNGGRPDVLRDVLSRGLVREIFVDVKAVFENYPLATGGRRGAAKAGRDFQEIFRMAADAPGTFTFRTTLVPHVQEWEIEAIRGMLPAGHELRVQAFVPTGRDVPEDGEGAAPLAP